MLPFWEEGKNEAEGRGVRIGGRVGKGNEANGGGAEFAGTHGGAEWQELCVGLVSGYIVVFSSEVFGVVVVDF